MRAKNAQNSTTVRFNCESTWKPTGGALHLFIEHSPDLDGSRSFLSVTLNYGTFINNIVGFVIIALAIFMMVRLMNRLYAQPAPVTESTKPCPECTLSIPIPAKRCPNCTAIIG
jgi:hypothetical protein